jgi:hypothetical protein
MDPAAQRKPCGDARRDAAGFLVAVALLGLVATPLLHAEEHWQEAHDDERAAAGLAKEWEASSRDPSDALAAALERVHGSRPRTPAHRQHSHGPSSGPHGSGSLAHLALALQAAPQISLPAPPPVAHGAPAVLRSQLRETLAQLIPQWSQAPPARC